MKRWTLFLCLLGTMLFASMAWADAASQAASRAINQAIEQGNYKSAETMLRTGIAQHPTSATAHYILARVLVKEGNIGEASDEANQAQQLDPAIKFTDAGKFQHFQGELRAALAPPVQHPVQTYALPRAVYTQPPMPRPNLSILYVLMFCAIAVVVLAGLIKLIMMMFARKPQENILPIQQQARAMPFRDYDRPNGSPQGSYAAPRPMVAQPVQPSAGVSQQIVQQGHSTGSVIGAGLGGLAAGMLLEDVLDHNRMTGSGGFPGMGNTGFVDIGSDPSARAYEDLRSEPVDMGNSPQDDFSDSNSPATDPFDSSIDTNGGNDDFSDNSAGGSDF